MSYCRFSSDNWKSDVYAYEHCEGHWQVHVAAQRLATPLPEVDNALVGGTPEKQMEWVEQMIAQSNEVSKAVHVPIDHTEAGSSREFGSPGELADHLKHLGNEGFHVPAGVIESLREEQDSMTPDEDETS